MPYLYDYTGVIHIHSAYSFDAHTPVADILKEAHRNRLDFLMLTDHDTLRAKEEGLEGWHGNTLLIVGQEISPRFNHYIAFDIDTPVTISRDNTDIPPQRYIDEVCQKGGFGFIAHPDHQGVPLFHVKHYPWLDWMAKGYTGIGIWDFMSDWQGSVTGYCKALFSILFPAFSLKGPREETLKRWDTLNQSTKIVGIGELDNHGSIRRFCGFPLTIFPFSKAFKFMRTHVLTETPFIKECETDAKMLFSALKGGRAYVSAEYYHEARGFSFTVTDHKRNATMGDNFPLQEKTYLVVLLPITAKIRIMRDGLLFREETTHNMTCRITQKGIYRVEAYQKMWGKYLPWIFSNHIHVKED